MKKVQSIIVFIALAVVLSAFTSAVTAPCTLSVSMVNQDPYPAVPDEYVKTVFQMNGADNSDCGKVFMRIVPQYPFSLDSNDSTVFMDSTFVSGYSSYLLAAYKLRVDKDVLDGENKIKIEYGKVDDLPNVLTKEFNIEVEDARTDFEVLIQDYTVATNSVTFAVVNIGKKDV